MFSDRAILAVVALSLAGLGTAWAGAPEAPGAGGQQIKADVQRHLDAGDVPGETIKDLRDTGGSLGERIQDFSATHGGTPSHGNE